MIDLIRFKEMLQPNQNYWEWLSFMEFVETYFKNRKITNPACVEIGIHTNCQKNFYKEFLGAEHIGIDISEKYSKPDILGDSQLPETLTELIHRLGGRKIDLLFIDAEHSYAAAKRELDIYGQLTQHLIAFHDIFAVKELGQLWEDVVRQKIDHPSQGFITFGCWQGRRYQIGIGLVIKGNGDN